jgi:hypothetical protein
MVYIVDNRTPINFLTGIAAWSSAPGKGKANVRNRKKNAATAPCPCCWHRPNRRLLLPTAGRAPASPRPPQIAASTGPPHSRHPSKPPTTSFFGDSDPAPPNPKSSCSLCCLRPGQPRLRRLHVAHGSRSLLLLGQLCRRQLRLDCLGRGRRGCGGQTAGGDFPDFVFPSK